LPPKIVILSEDNVGKEYIFPHRTIRGFELVIHSIFGVVDFSISDTEKRIYCCHLVYFICDLFNGAINRSDYIAKTDLDRMWKELLFA
jgi:hypothetical protein